MNGDLISRNKAIETIRAYGVRGSGWSDSERESDVCDMLDGVPAEDAEIVRHGRWSSVNEYCNHADQFSCSECNGLVFYNYYTRSCDYEYCPNCGCKMDAKEDAK